MNSVRSSRTPTAAALLCSLLVGINLGIFWPLAVPSGDADGRPQFSDVLPHVGASNAHVAVASLLSMSHLAAPRFVNHIFLLAPLHPLLRCEGVLRARPEPVGDAWRVTADVAQCAVWGLWMPLRGRVELVAPGSLAHLQRGSSVAWFGRLQPITFFRNPGSWELGFRRVIEKISARVEVRAARWVWMIAPPSRVSLSAWLSGVGGRIGAALARDVSDLDTAAVLRALLLGEGGTLSQSWWDAFARTGVIHLLIVSGMQITALALLCAAALVWMIRKLAPTLFFRVPAPLLRWSIAALFAWCACFMSSDGPSAIRSAWMLTIFAGVRVSARAASLWWCWCATAGVMLLGAPPLFWSPSFQLTFAALAGLIWIAPARAWVLARCGWRECDAVMRERSVGVLSSSSLSSSSLRCVAPIGTMMTANGRRWLIRWARALCTLCAATIGAALWTAPLVVYHLGAWSAISFAANLVMVPFVEAVVMPCALIVAGCALCMPAIPAWCVLIITWLVHRMLACVLWWNQWSDVWMWRRVPSGVVLLCWYSALWWLRRRRSWRAYGSALVVGVACISVCFLVPRALEILSSRVASSPLRLTVFDVGQGSSALLQLPNGRAYLIDAGGIAGSPFDIGARVVVPALRHLGVSHLDGVILTHFHPDHYLGLPAVVQAFGVRSIFVNDSRAAMNDPSWPSVDAALRAGGVSLQPLRTGMTWREGDVAFFVLHPESLLQSMVTFASSSSSSSSSSAPSLFMRGENDHSVVMRITYGTRTVLLTGDIEKAAEDQLLRSNANVQSDVVVVPHHGSDTSSTDAFVRATRAQIAIISCGMWNRYRFPRLVVRDRWRAIGAQIWRTDLHGAVTVTISENSIAAESLLARPWWRRDWLVP